MSNRLLKKELIAIINKIDDEKILAKIDKIVKEDVKHEPNIHKLKELAGTISDDEYERMKKLINEEFSKIEGEW